MDDFVTVLMCIVSFIHVKKLRDELSRALVEANGEDVNEGAAESFNELVNEIVSKGQDLRAFAFKTKAMVNKKNYSFILLF